MPVLTLTLNCANFTSDVSRRIELDHAMPKQPLTLLQTYVDSPDATVLSDRQIAAKATFDAAATAAQAYYNTNSVHDGDLLETAQAAALDCKATGDEWEYYDVDEEDYPDYADMVSEYADQDNFMPNQLWIELPFLTNFDSNSNHVQSSKGVFMIHSGEDTIATYGRGQRFTLSKDVSQNMQFEVYDEFGQVYTERFFKIHLLFHYDKENLF